jgi:hypothetical protein
MGQVRHVVCDASQVSHGHVTHQAPIEGHLALLDVMTQRRQ